METESELPREILSKIFGHLSYFDLGNVLLVSRLWKDGAEDPWLWKDFTLNVNNCEIFIELMKNQRFSCLRKIKVSAGFVTSEEDARILFSELEKHIFIKELNLCHNDIKSVCPRTLAKCLNKLEKVKNVELADLQILELFNLISNGTNLKEVEIFSTNFESIPEDIFSLAINNLNRLNLKFSILTKEQIEIMFKTITEDTSVKDIDIAGNDNLYKMNVSGFAPYVSGFAPYERTVQKLVRMTKGKYPQKLRKHSAWRKRGEMQAILLAIRKTSVV